MARVFISYRRRDNPYVAGILRDALQGRFGIDEVFFDLDNIPFGVDFRQYIANAVGSCGVLLVVIGDQWLHLADEQGRRRLDNRSDFVRIEIEAALKRDIPVVPVLIETAQMPAESELPESIREFAFRNAAEIRAGRDLKHQVERLVSGLAESLKARISRPAEEDSAPLDEEVPVAPEPRGEIARSTEGITAAAKSPVEPMAAAKAKISPSKEEESAKERVSTVPKPREEITRSTKSESAQAKRLVESPEEEFSPSPQFKGAKVITIRQKDLRDGLRKTSYAVSTDETRWVLNGVLFSLKEKKLRLVATDGRRIAMVDIELQVSSTHEADMIVPTKAIMELQSLLTDEGDVKVSFGSGKIAFDLNNTSFVSKLIEGNYPNYRQSIPTRTKERVTLQRETFLNSLRRVSRLASDEHNSIKLSFSKNNIVITAITPELSESKEAKESLPVAYNGREFSVGFNPEFLMAPLRNLSEDEVFLDLTDEKSPGVLRVQGPFIYVLMPMRIGS